MGSSGLPPVVAAGAAPCRSPGLASALGLYVLATVVLTWPLSARLTTHVPAGDNDLWQNYWNFWWWRTALVERGQSPYRTDLIYQPGGASLAFHTHGEASIISTLPLQAVGGVPLALNAAVLLSFVLCAWGGYFLAREVTGNARAAFVAGLVLGFFPHRAEQSLEHLNLISFQAMPFFLAFFLRLLRRGGVVNGAASGLLFALNALYGWHNGLLSMPLAAVLFGHALVRGARPRLRLCGGVALAAAVALAIIVPCAWPMLREILAGETYHLKPPVNKSIDPLFLLVPSEMHPLWGEMVSGAYARLRGYASLGFTCYLGVAAVALWFAGRNTLRAEWRLWTALFLLCVVLACGDRLVVAGADTGVPLPFALLREVPILGAIRLPNRFVVPAMVALSVLCALGVLGLPRRLAWAAALAVVIDYVALPYPTRSLPHPPWIDAVRSAPPGLLLDVPGGHRARGAEDMYFQTLHGRPMVGGYASCTPPDVEERVRSLPFLQLIFEGRPQVTAGVEAGLRQTLETLPVGVVVVHRDRAREVLEARRRDLGGGSQARQHNPEQGTAARVIDEARTALRKLWGEPVHAGPDAEVFVRPR